MEQVLIFTTKNYFDKFISKHDGADSSWNVNFVTGAAVELLGLLKNEKLSEKQKCELVCQTILKVLDDEEKAGKEHLQESIVIERTKVLGLIREMVANRLPAILDQILLYDKSSCFSCCRSVSVEEPEVSYVTSVSEEPVYDLDTGLETTDLSGVSLREPPPNP